MRIAVDVMGGDHGCGVIVDGVLQALEEFQALQSAMLVGRESEIEGALAGRSTSSGRVSVCHAQEVLSMHDKAMDAVRHSLLARAMPDLPAPAAVAEERRERARGPQRPGGAGADLAAGARPLAAALRAGQGGVELRLALTDECLRRSNVGFAQCDLCLRCGHRVLDL